MFFHHLLAGPTAPRRVPAARRCCGSSPGSGWRSSSAALQQVIARHDIFRTSVAWEGLPEPVQVVWRQAAAAGHRGDRWPGDGGPGGGAAGGGRAADGPGPGAAAAAARRGRAGHRPAGWRCCRSTTWCWTTPALEVVLAEIAALLAGRADQLPAPLPFRDFVAQARLGTPREEHERYFAGLLGDVTEPTAPFGLLDARGDGSTPARPGWRWTRGLAGRLREQARPLGCRPATVFHLAWARVLAVVAGRDDVVFGTVLFGRMDAGPGADRVPGLFMNTLPVRVRVGAAGGGRRGGRDARAAGRAAGPRARPAGAGPAGQRRAAAGAAVHRLLNYRHSARAGRRAGAAGVPGIARCVGRGADQLPADRLGRRHRDRVRAHRARRSRRPTRRWCARCCTPPWRAWPRRWQRRPGHPAARRSRCWARPSGRRLLAELERHRGGGAGRRRCRSCSRRRRPRTPGCGGGGLRRRHGQLRGAGRAGEPAGPAAGRARARARSRWWRC